MSSLKEKPILTREEARQKRDQLIQDGFCVVPGILRGEMLEKVRKFTHDFLDEHPVDPRHRYQGSDFHIMAERVWEKRLDKRGYHSPVVDELLDLPEARQACEALQLEGMHSGGTIIILNKPPYGPPLYWHQDNMHWNHPRSALPWPTQVFLSYYLVDTTRENGCLRVIPGTHRKRIPLHEFLPAAHGPEIQAADESHPAFMAHPDEIDICVKAGDLVIADARVLHAAWPNKTAERRPLVLEWWSVFPFPTVPSWWEGEIPDVIHTDPNATYELTRIPGKYLGGV
jgi:ectoine hydroxylase-related dioxygenase (phytanoyl-CoA dioxygenase family)